MSELSRSDVRGQQAAGRDVARRTAGHSGQAGRNTGSIGHGNRGYRGAGHRRDRLGRRSGSQPRGCAGGRGDRHRRQRGGTGACDRVLGPAPAECRRSPIPSGPRVWRSGQVLVDGPARRRWPNSGPRRHGLPLTSGGSPRGRIDREQLRWRSGKLRCDDRCRGRLHPGRKQPHADRPSWVDEHGSASDRQADDG
jgi:hypothetical protein